MRVLVTGAGGYLGRAVVTALVAAGHESVAMLHRDRAAAGGLETRVADILDPASVAAAIHDVDAVCHLAGLTRARESWDRPLDYFEVNVAGTIALLKAMHAEGIGRLVFASTGSIYGSPERQPMAEELQDAPPHPYAGSKAVAESVIEWEARRGHLACAVLRLFNAAGGQDPDSTRIVPRVLAVAAGETPQLAVNGDGSATRDYLHFQDAAEAFVAALERGPELGTVRRYNIGSGTGTSIADVISAAERVTGRTIPVLHKPPAAEPPMLVCDPSRAQAELGWKPRRSDVDTIVRGAWAARG